MREMLHELAVHQIELELQNEELRAAQADLDVLRARYFDLYDMAPVGYCTLSEQGMVLEANLTAATLLGVDRGALVKQPVSRFIFKEDQDIYYKHRQRLFKTGDPQQCELRMVKPDGSTFWVYLQAVASQDEEGAPSCRIALSDISGRKRAEKELRANEEKFFRLFESMMDGFVSVSMDGAFLECNEVYLSMLGYSRAELARLTYLDITPEKWHAFEDDIVQNSILKRGYSDVYQKEYRRKDGSVFPVELRTVLIRDERGNPAGMWGIIRDITEQKLTEQKVLNLNLELEAQVAERTSALQGTIVELKTQISERRRLEREVLKISDYEQSRIGRDLHDDACQGLAGIAVLAEVVSRDLDGKNPQAAAKVLRFSGLARSSLDAIRRLAAGLVPVKIEQRGLDWALRDLADETSSRNHVRCVFTNRGPITISDSGVAVQLFRIVQEAVSNSLRHGRAQNIAIVLDGANGTASLVIRDDGVGLPRRRKSDGLGLHTMLYRAKMLGGSLEVRRSAKGGTVVACSFPEMEFHHGKEKTNN